MSDDGQDQRIQELEEEIRRLRAMLESAPDFIARVGVDGTIQYVNRPLPGLSPAEVLGAPSERFVAAEYHARAREALRLACETGETQEYATLGPRRGEQLGHFLTRVSPVREDGALTSLLMIATDVVGEVTALIAMPKPRPLLVEPPPRSNG